MRLLVLAAAAALAGPVLAQPAASPPVPAPAAAAPSPEDASFTAFLDRVFDERAALSPETLTGLGLKDRYGELDDRTLAGVQRRQQLQERRLAEMKRSFNRARLSPSAQTSWRVFETEVADDAAELRWRDHGFVFRANRNPAGNLPVFLINEHKVATVADAQAYVSRLRAAERVMGEEAAALTRRAAKGLVPPRLVFAPAIADTRKVITGAPFGAGPDTAVWADFQTKVKSLKLAPAEEARLLADGRAALTGPFQRGYQKTLAALEAAAPTAVSDDGIWRLPDGPAYYAHQLRSWTTTDLTADQVHQTGLDEVARIHAEMDAIQKRVGFAGTRQDFMRHFKTAEQFRYPNTPEGKAQYLKDATAYVAQVMAAAPAQFRTLPTMPLEVRAVEPFREATASVAFYNRGTADGTRPGIFYVNLSDLTQVSKPSAEAIAYHEGAPGHHFQIALAQENDGLPKLRRYGGYGAYSEGWGLYAEQLGKEMGFYTDPYNDFGRLGTEVWRAARLVVDTGLHHKRWSRAQAMQYFRDNTLVSELDIQREVDRYITNPGQATSYKIGQLKILELRQKARTVLGERFDIRDFHEVVLGEGSLPLDLLEERVDAFVAGRLQGTR